MTTQPNMPPVPHPASGSGVPKAHESAAKRDWPAYFKAVEGKPARDTLLKALENFDKEDAGQSVGLVGSPKDQAVARTPKERFAIDLGCGSGRDTLELLRRGWRVLAIDGSPEGMDRLVKSIPPEHRARLETRVEGFEGLTLPRADLVNASYSIPFCDPDAFPRLCDQIKDAIPVGGRFSGQLFGPRDDWAELPDRSHTTRSQVDQLFQDFTLEQFQEVENREAGATGEVKNWHIFHVVAKRRE